MAVLDWKGSRNSYSLGDPTSLMDLANKQFNESMENLGKQIGVVDQNHKDANAARLLETMRQYQTNAEMSSPEAQAHIQNTLNSFGSNIDRQAALLYEQKRLGELSQRDTVNENLRQSIYTDKERTATNKLVDMIGNGATPQERKAYADEMAEQGIFIEAGASSAFNANRMTKAEAELKTLATNEAVILDKARGIANLVSNGKIAEAEQLIQGDQKLAYFVNQLVTGTGSEEANLLQTKLNNQRLEQDIHMGRNAQRVSDSAINQYFGTSPQAKMSKNYSETIKKLDNPVARATREKYGQNFIEASETFGVPLDLLVAVMGAESAGNPNTKNSSAGAKGLMQFMRPTFNEEVKGTPYANQNFDTMTPEASIYVGAKYLKKLIDHYGGDENKALAAYNAGMGRIDGFVKESQKSGGREWSNYLVPETKDYLERVGDLRVYLGGGSNSGGGNGGGGYIAGVDGTLKPAPVTKEEELDPKKNPATMRPVMIQELKADIATNYPVGGKNYLGGEALQLKDFRTMVEKTQNHALNFLTDSPYTNTAALDALDYAIADNKIKGWDKVPPERRGHVAKLALNGYEPNRILNSFHPNISNYNEVIKRTQQAVDAELIRQNTARNSAVQRVTAKHASKAVSEFGYSQEDAFAFLGLGPDGISAPEVKNPLK